jgi:hypothetical protein
LNVIKPYRFISHDEIEHRANDILKLMQQTQKYALKWPLDATRVAEFLDLDVVWDKIPPDEQGLIAARILPLERLIEINEDILKLPKGFESSTVAHEVGHWVLHINSEEIDKFLKHLKQNVEINTEPFLCRNYGTLSGIEHQAQYFSSCLTMPKFRLEEVQKGRNLTNWQHLYAMKDELGVTISNLTTRLKVLNWIVLNKTSKQIYLGKSAPSNNK